MWQMAATVMVVVLLAYSRSVVYARALEDAPGEDGQDQKVTRVDDIDSRALELPWNIVIRTTGDGNPYDVKLPHNAFLTYDLRFQQDPCKAEGIYKAAPLCDYFYFCIPNDEDGAVNKFHQVAAICEDGYYFDNDTKKCSKGPCWGKPDKQLGDAPRDPDQKPSTALLGPAAEPKPAPSPAAQQVPSWFSKEPDWYNKQPEFYKTAPFWFYTPPAWYNNLLTTYGMGEQKAQILQGGHRPEVGIVQGDQILKNAG